MNVKLTEIKNNGTPWLKIPADGSQITFTGNADEAAKEFFNALIRVRDGYISALKAERDALAVENQALKDVFGSGEAVVNFLSIALRHTKYDCIDLPDVALAFKMSLPETPVTDAALAAIEAQGVEKFADFLDSPIDGQHCYQNEVGLARHFASTLREAK